MTDKINGYVVLRSRNGHHRAVIFKYYLEDARRCFNDMWRSEPLHDVVVVDLSSGGVIENYTPTVAGCKCGSIPSYFEKDFFESKTRHCQLNCNMCKTTASPGPTPEQAIANWNSLQEFLAKG